MQFLIDANGVEWDTAQPWLYQHLRFRGTAHELTDFAVRNLGYVSAIIERNYLRIKLRPDYFPVGAFERLVGVLNRISPSRIIIERDLDAHGVVDILTEPSDAVARLIELREPTAPRSGTKFLTDTMSLDRLNDESGTLLANAYRQWRQQRGQLAKQTVRSLFDDPLRAPWLVGRIEGDDGFVTRTMPEYVNFWGTGTRADLIGRPIGDHPDKDFGNAAEKSYLAAHRLEMPSLELVTMVVRPETGPMHWARYHRLILPWRLSDGSALLSNVSAVRIARDLATSAAA